MGTRNLTMVVVGGVTKVAQYGQWDGYFSGQGSIIAAFLDGVLSDPLGLARMRSQLRRARFGSADEINRLWEQQGSAGCPELSRDTGAAILSLIYDWPTDGPEPVLNDDSSFISDALFCEYAYTVDFDDQTVTVVYGWPNRVTRLFTFDEFVQAMRDEEAVKTLEGIAAAANPDLDESEVG